VLEHLGWVYDRTAGSHKQYIQPGRPGIETVKIRRMPYYNITPRLMLRQIGVAKREFAEVLRRAR
jgi:predicted RNA binding protein YcfA (HicA-like mRNA interferase family)